MQPLNVPYKIGSCVFSNPLRALHSGKFFMLFCRLQIFFKIIFFEKFFQEYHLSVKQIGSRSGPTFFVGPDLGPNCLQRLSADDTRRQRVNSFYAIFSQYWYIRL